MTTYYGFNGILLQTEKLLNDTNYQIIIIMKIPELVQNNCFCIIVFKTAKFTTSKCTHWGGGWNT